MGYKIRALWITTAVLYGVAIFCLVLGSQQRTTDMFGFVSGGELWISLGTTLLWFGTLSIVINIAAGAIIGAVSRQTLLIQQWMSQTVMGQGIQGQHPPQVPRSTYNYPQA